MRQVYPILFELVPEFEAVCEVLRVNLLNPILEGGAPRIEDVKLSGKGGSVLSRLDDAVEKARANPASGGTITELNEDESMAW